MLQLVREASLNKDVTDFVVIDKLKEDVSAKGNVLSEVYKIRDNVDEEEYMLEIYKFNLLTGDEGLEYQKKNIIKRLAFMNINYGIKNIAKLYHVDIKDDIRIISELPQQRLSEKLATEKTSFLQRKRWIYQLCVTFNYLFENNILYSKMKTRTIRLSKSGDILITKFKMEYLKNYSPIYSYIDAPEKVLYYQNKKDFPIFKEYIKNTNRNVQYNSLLLWEFGMLCLSILYEREEITKHNTKEVEIVGNGYGFFNKMFQNIIAEFSDIADVRLRNFLCRNYIIIGVLMENPNFDNFRNKIIAPVIENREIDTFAKVIFDHFIKLDHTARSSYADFLNDNVFWNVKKDFPIPQNKIVLPFKKPVPTKLDKVGDVIYDTNDTMNRKYYDRISRVISDRNHSATYYISLDFVIQNAYQIIENAKTTRHFIIACFWVIDNAIGARNKNFKKLATELFKRVSAEDYETIRNYVTQIITTTKGIILLDSLYLYVSDPKYAYRYLYYAIYNYNSPAQLALEIKDKELQKVVEDKRREMINADLGPSGYKASIKLGEGSQGDVYIVEKEGNRYACKTYPYRIRKYNVYIGNGSGGMDEIAFNHLLEHPYIIKIHDFYAGKTMFFSISELADATLETKLKSLTIDQKIKYIYQFASACDYVRSNGIVHCDLKPDNILIKDDTIKIADFGLAKMLEFSNAKRCTATLYQSPESFDPPINNDLKHYNNVVKPNNFTYEEKMLANDLWTFGLLFLEIVYGKEFIFDEYKEQVNSYRYAQYYYVDKLAEYYEQKTIPEILMEEFGNLDGQQKELLILISPFIDIDPVRRSKTSLKDLIETDIFKRNGYFYMEPERIKFASRIRRYNQLDNGKLTTSDYEKVIPWLLTEFSDLNYLTGSNVGSRAQKIKDGFLIILIDFIYQYADKYCEDYQTMKLFSVCSLWILYSVILSERIELFSELISRMDDYSDVTREMYKMIFKILTRTKCNVLCDSVYYHLEMKSEYYSDCLNMMTNPKEYLNFKNFEEAAKKIIKD